MFDIRKVSKLFSVYIISDVLGKGAAFLMVPLYTRFLSPDEFGILAFARSLQPISNIFLSLGMQGVAFRFYYVYTEKEERERFYGTIWVFLICTALVFSIFLTVLGNTVLSNLLRQVPFHPYITLTIWISFFRVGFELLFLQYLRAKESGNLYLIFNIVSFTIFVLSQVLFIVLLRRGVTGALMGNLVTVAVMALFYSVLMIREYAIVFESKYIRPALSYALPLVPHFISNWGLNLSDRVILDRFVPLSSIGMYSVGDYFRQGYQLLSSGLENATRPIYGRASQEDQKKENLPVFITYYIIALVLVGLAIYLFAPEVMAFLAPEEYDFAEKLVPWLILGMVFQGLYWIPMNLLTQVVGETRGIAKVTFAAALTNILLNLYFVPKYGILAAAINTTIAYFVLFVLMAIRASNYIRLEYEFSRIVKVIFLAILLALFAHIIPVSNAYLNMIIKFIFIGSFPFGLGIISFFTREEKYWIKYSMRKVRTKIF